MVKTLRYSLLAILAIVCNVAFADEVKFDFDNDYATLFPTLKGVSNNDVHDGDFTEATTATLEGYAVTVSAAAEGISNANRIWYSSPRLRMYSGTLTIAAPAGKKIKSITFNSTKWDASNKADVGTLDNTKKIWEGEAETVVISIAKNTQMKSLTVSTGVQEVVDITNTPETAYTVAKAHELITADQGLDAKVYVKGTVTTITEVSMQYGNATFCIDDAQATSKKFTAFRCVWLGGAKFTSEDQIQDGDEVILYGQLMNHSTGGHQMNPCEIYSINGKTSTGIEAVEAADNGKQAVYTIGGQRVEKAQKGLNIINGKKVIVK